MKNLVRLTNIVGTIATLALMAACQTVATNDAELAASRKEFVLAQSGFKVITVTTPKQQQAINGLVQYRVSAVKYNGKLYYVFPTAKKDKIYVGRQKQSLPLHRRQTNPTSFSSFPMTSATVIPASMVAARVAACRRRTWIAWRTKG